MKEAVLALWRFVQVDTCRVGQNAVRWLSKQISLAARNYNEKLTASQGVSSSEANIYPKFLLLKKQSAPVVCITNAVCFFLRLLASG